MAGDPHYLALLDKLEPTDASEFSVLPHLWSDLIDSPRSTFVLRQIAEVCLGYITEYHRFDQDSFQDKWDRIIIDAQDLHIRKNAGYAGTDNSDPWANFRMCQDFGIDAIDGVITRMSDKYIRIQNLQRDPNNERVGESLIDTIRDLAAYALIAICLIEEQQNDANDEYTLFMIRELLSDAITAVETELKPSFITQEAREGLQALMRFRDA